LVCCAEVVWPKAATVITNASERIEKILIVRFMEIS